MSAILKALRKIEQESSGQVRSASVSRPLDAKKTLNQRARKRWLIGRLSVVLGLILVLAAGIVLGFAYKPWFSGSSPASTDLAHLPEETVNAMPGQDAGAAPQGTKSPVNERVPGKGSAGVSPTPEPPRMAQSAQKADRRAAEPPPSRGKAAAPAESPPVLELQAIVWSDDPESCFAVINGHIVRANGTVEGVTVTEISPDAVFLKHGDKTWKIRMLEGD